MYIFQLFRNTQRWIKLGEGGGENPDNFRIIAPYVIHLHGNALDQSQTTTIRCYFISVSDVVAFFVRLCSG